MREPVTPARIREFMSRIGDAAKGPARIFITGGGTAVLVEPKKLRELFERIKPELYRYPALDPVSFERRLNEALQSS